MNTKYLPSNQPNLWTPLVAVIKAILIGFAVVLIGIGLWDICFLFIPIPWSLLIMSLLLLAYLAYFSGRWPGDKTSVLRKISFRNTKLSPRQWRWGLLAALLFVVVFQSSFVVTFRLIPFPVLAFKSQYKILDHLPTWLAWLTIIVSSMVAGICEETGFRGYMQVPLEKRFGVILGILITSLFFFLLHLDKSWAPLIIIHIFFASVLLGLLASYSGSLLPGIIGHTLMDICNFSYWWSNVAGNFEKKTVFETGLDTHFVLWSLVFLLTTFLFFLALIKLKKGKIPPAISQ